MADVTEKMKFSWPVVIVLLSLVAGGAGAIARSEYTNASQGKMLDEHDRKIDAHERELTAVETKLDFLIDWAKRHEK